LPAPEKNSRQTFEALQEGHLVYVVDHRVVGYIERITSEILSAVPGILIVGIATVAVAAHPQRLAVDIGKSSGES